MKKLFVLFFIELTIISITSCYLQKIKCEICGNQIELDASLGSCPVASCKPTPIPSLK